MTKCPTCGSFDLRPYTVALEPPKGTKKPIMQHGTICWNCRMYCPTIK